MRRPFKLYMAEALWQAGMPAEDVGAPLRDSGGVIVEFSEAQCRNRANKTPGARLHRTYQIVTYKRLG